MDLEAIYHRTPAWMQNLAVSAVGWNTNRQRFGKDFTRFLEAYERRLTWSPEQMRRFRDERIHAFVQHCEVNVPYYRKLFKELQISAASIRGLAGLKNLPILDKNTVKENYHDLLAENIPASQRVVIHTSGTTGGGLRFASTPEALSEQWALWWRYRKMHGLDRTVWCAYFGGRSVVPLTQRKPPFWRTNYPGRQILFSGYHMNPANMESYVAELQQKRPPWLHGYPSLLALLASHLLNMNASLGYEVRWITIGAESLLQQQSDLIERAFGIKPLQHYGLAEAVANISEDRDGVLRVDEDFAAVEFIPNGEGQGYRIIGTNLSNLATPLLRYDTMDLADLPDGADEAGEWGRRVATIDGRKEDYIVLSDGTRIGRMDHVFKDLVQITEAQLVQRAPGKVLVRIVRGAGYSGEDERALRRELRKRVGDLADFQIDYVEAIARSSTGKLRFVVSETPVDAAIPESEP